MKVRTIEPVEPLIYTYFMITLYAASRTRAFRILWLLEELELEFDLKKMSFKPTSDKFYIQDTPTGKIPTLEDGDITMCESGAIIQYILERYADGQLEPAPDSPSRAAYLQWLHYAESSAFGPLGNIVWLTQYRSDSNNQSELIVDAKARADAALQFIEQRLTGDYLAGEFSAADIMMGFTLLAAAELGVLNESMPKLAAYLGRLARRPPFQKSLAELT